MSDDPKDLAVLGADGSCIARFGRQGTDVHRDVAAMLGEGQCLD